jgi:ligand-binding sensor domain-containing protein/DNA-binding CsgD family transcriptional regulator
MVYNEKYNSVFISVRDVGVAIYNIDTEKATLLNKNATFASNYTIDNPQTVFFSQKQDIYVGSFYQGIQIGFSPEVNTQFTSIHFLKNQKTPDKILSILQLAPDKLLIGTDNNGLFSYTPSSNTFQEIAVKNQQGTPIKVFKTLYKDKKQCVWMGHWISGMTQWNLQSNEKKTYTNSEKPPYALRTDRANPIWGFTEDLDSNFWVINLWGEVICYFNDGKKSIQYDDKHGMQGLGSSQLLDIHCDRKGNIWVASERNGFWVKWRNSSQFEQFKADRSDPDAISSNNGFFIFEDSKGQMWFGTADQGLNLYEEPTKHFRKYTTANGLLSNCNMSMTEDDMGNLWITSSSGLTCMANKDGQYTVKFKYLPSFKNKFSHLATLYAPDESKLYIGGDAGITMLETKSLEYTAQAPKVFVSSINYHEQSNHINIDSILSLLNTQKTIKTTKQNAFISLEIACSSLNNTNFNEFAYLLEGYEEEWHYLKEGAHTITYTGLPEGNYQLKVKAKTINSDWGAVSQYTIQVGARLWERAWFNYFMIFLCLFLLLGELYLSKKHREISKIKKILQIEKEALEKNNAELASKVESWSSKLLAQSAEMIRQKEILTDVKNQINNSYYSNNVTDQDANIHKLNLTLEKGLNKDEDWEKFRLYFDHINQSFTQRLTQTYPHLTHHDINLCMLIKLGMGSHEIAKIMNITLYGVQKSRFRLKKKLNLDREENLIEHILSF